MVSNKDILQAIADHLGVSLEDLDRQASLRDDLGLGPIELNDLLNAVALKFDMVFSPEDVENLKKLDDLVILVEDNLLD